MSTIRNTVDIDVWPVNKLLDAVSSTPAGSSRVTIPEYQRRLVWNRSKRKGLIDSIKQGFPFGSILLYENIAKGQEISDGKRYYNLIDGLQRTQALMSYVEFQNGYFERADLNDAFVDEVAKELGKSNDEYKDRIRTTVVDWVKGRKSYDAQDGWRTESLVQALIDKVLRYARESSLYKDLYFELNNNAALMRCLGRFLDEVSSEVKIVLDAKIPVLIFTGVSKQLPEIFERLNSKGTALSRYEIFAAQWIDRRRKIANPEIIEAIWRKYDALEEEGFTLDVAEDAQDEKAKRDREYTLFDYLFGFGQFLPDKFPRLFKPSKDDRPSSAGFNLATACLGLHIGEMADLPSRVANFDLTELEGCLLESVRFVDGILKPVLDAKRIKSRPHSIYHSELMIVAMIATAFQVRYSLHDLSDNPESKPDRKKLKKRLLMHYLYEILHDDWRGSGDSKLYDAVKSLRYLMIPPPTEARWQQVFDDWYFATQIDYVHNESSKRHIRESRSEYLLLKYVFRNRLDSANTYHVEHIVPVDNIKARMQQGEEWPMNTVGNLALLKIAGEFKDNFHTFDEMLRLKRQSGEITTEQHEALLAEYAERLLCPPEYLPKATSKKEFENFLMRRWELLKSEFLDVWRDHIPADPPA